MLQYQRPQRSGHAELDFRNIGNFCLDKLLRKVIRSILVQWPHEIHHLIGLLDCINFIGRWQRVQENREVPCDRTGLAGYVECYELDVFQLKSNTL